MGDPFVGYVRDPSSVSDNPTPEHVSSAIAAASAKYGVPVSALDSLWKTEALHKADPYQEVGFNSAGYGGFFGLPSSMLGGVDDQAGAAAGILQTLHDRFGSWEAALSAYRSGSPTGGNFPGDTSSAQTVGNIPGLPIPNPFDLLGGIGSGALKNSILDPGFWKTNALNVGASAIAVLMIGIGLIAIASEGVQRARRMAP